MHTATNAVATPAFTSTAVNTRAHSTFPRDAGFSGRDAKNDLMFAATLSVMLAACAIWPIAASGDATTTAQPTRAAAVAQAPVAMARLDTVVIHRSKPAASAVVAAADAASTLDASPAAALAGAARHASAPSGGKTL